MHDVRPGAILATCCLPLLLLTGCSTTPPLTSVSSRPAVFTSRDGVLHYRLPAGWFDATADSLANEHVVWLLRYDYAVSLTVDEIHLDAQARRQLGNENLQQLARLTLPLVAGDKAAVVHHAPELFSVDGREFCSFELVMPGSGKRLRRVLFDTGAKSYDISIVYEEKEKGGNAYDVGALQDGFVKSLRW